MKSVELDLIITKISNARTCHDCTYCKRTIRTNEHYTKLTVRIKGERFPTNIAVCNDHKLELIPIGVVLNGKI